MDFEKARKHMVDSQVRTNDVTDLRIQAALETIPREKFLPAELRAQAYIDREIAYAPGRSLITARDFAKLLNALSIRRSDLVLDVGCGAGYSSAVIALLGEMVVAIDSDEAQAAQAQETLNALGVVNVAVITGDPTQGAPTQGPFDVIVIAAPIAVEPQGLLKQLKDGGRLGAIVRSEGVSRGVIWRRSAQSFGRTTVFDAAASVIAPGFTRPKAFVF